MSNLTSYIIFWMVLFVILGTFWYIIDRRYGVKWYRFWYNLTHPEKLPDDVDAGFIYNRRSRHKAIMASLLSTLQTVVAFVSIESVNPLVELILWIVEVPMTMLGFVIGPWTYKLWRGRDEVFDALDEINAKDRKGKPVPGEGSKEEKAKENSVQSDESHETEPETERVKDDDKDPREMMRRYTDPR